MDNKDKLIISKLLKLASKRQQILVKMAQTVPTDDSKANIEYLKSAWQTAALNSGVEVASTPTVNYTPPAQVDGTDLSGNYTVSGEIAANKRELMLRQFKNQIKSQKPELDGKVSTIFNDPTTPRPV